MSKLIVFYWADIAGDVEAEADLAMEDALQTFGDEKPADLFLTMEEAFDFIKRVHQKV